MLITHKIQCFPNQTQIQIINQTLGACRWIYNNYLACNIDTYNHDKSFMSAYDFSKKLTKLKKSDLEYEWLNEISQKAVKEAIIDAYKSFKKFFNKTGGFPKFKSKHRNQVTSYYLYPVKGQYKHNKIKLPLLGWMRICENSYTISSHIINARMIKTKQNKYFIQLSTEVPSLEREILSPAIGIDVGIKKYLSISTKYNITYQIDSFIRDKKIVKYQEKIAKFQRIISNKAEFNYAKLLHKYLDQNYDEELTEKIKNKLKGVSYSSTNIFKVRKKIIALNKKISDYKINRINHLISSLVKTKPEYIAIENLSITQMVSKECDNHKTTLSKYIMESKFYYFRSHLMHKCLYYNIPIHLANRYFASSKKCSVCGNKNKDLKLSDRLYICNKCGHTIDRDLNSAINLVHMKKKEYTLI